MPGRTPPGGTPADLIEARAKMHPEGAEAAQAADVKAAEPGEMRDPILDDHGDPVEFEGYTINELISKIFGDFNVDLKYVRKGSLIRFEGVAVVKKCEMYTEIKGKIRREVREQKCVVQHVEAWPERPGLGKPKHVDAKLAEAIQAAMGEPQLFGDESEESEAGATE